MLIFLDPKLCQAQSWKVDSRHLAKSLTLLRYVVAWTCSACRDKMTMCMSSHNRHALPSHSLEKRGGCMALLCRDCVTLSKSSEGICALFHVATYSRPSPTL